MKIIKVSSSQGCLGKNIGCEKAPDEVVKELSNIYSNEKGWDSGFIVGTVKVVLGNIDETNKNILEKEGDIFVGGDHSITYSCVKSFKDNFGDVGLLVFDAHPDCYLDDKNFLNHENYVAFLVKGGIVKPENIVLVGIRNSDPKEISFLKENKIKYFTMKQIYGNINDVCDTIMEIVREFSNLYVSIDIDVVDPAFAPGTGYLEPGGMSSRDLIYFLQRLKLLKNLKRLDLVEINPDKDINGMTVKLGAKIIKEVI